MIYTCGPYTITRTAGVQLGYLLPGRGDGVPRRGKGRNSSGYIVTGGHLENGAEKFCGTLREAREYCERAQS
jgi:hypothetical protein